MRCVALLAQVTHGYLTSDMHSSDELHSGTYDCGEGGTADRDEIKEREERTKMMVRFSIDTDENGPASEPSFEQRRLFP